jgi:hypothetical protein
VCRENEDGRRENFGELTIAAKSHIPGKELRT